jgi:hypothetical protein
LGVAGLRRKLHEDGRAHIDEAAIFEAYRRLLEHEARAVSETKRTRRTHERNEAVTGALIMAILSFFCAAENDG